MATVFGSAECAKKVGCDQAFLNSQVVRGRIKPKVKGHRRYFAAKHVSKMKKLLKLKKKGVFSRGRPSLENLKMLKAAM